MAMTHDYLDYLNEKVGIAPANSQEELQAAQTISELMAQHDVEPRLEEFSAPALAGVIPSVLSVAMFVGVLVSGLGVLPLTLIGLVLALVPTVLAVLRLLGREVSLSFGPSAQSQNVVAVHRATGPLVTKGNRTIVVVAHYDSPRENPLVSSPVAPYLPLITKLSVPCSYVVAACAFLQLLGFIPDVVRIVLWIVGILAAVPALALAVGSIAQRMAACTLGANDNKSSVAALLGVLENVRPSGMVPRERPVAPAEPVAEQAPVESEAVEAPEAMEAQETRDFSAAVDPEPSEPVYEEVVGVRRGAEVLRSLGMLPEDCEIEYVAPSLISPTVEAPAPVAPEVSETAPQPRVAQASETAPLAPVEEAAAEPAAPVVAEGSEEADATREDLLSTGRFSIVMDDGSRPVGEKDSTGLTNTDESGDSDTTQATQPVARPTAPTDPEWGKSSYRPQLSSVARRASLFDLPDPSENEVDPFATDPNATRVRAPQPAASPAPAPVITSERVTAPEPIGTISPAPAEAEPTRHNPLSGLLSKLKRRGKGSADAAASSGWLGADDSSADDDGGMWRGGAAPRAGLRLVDEEDAPSEEELRDAVLKLGDDALISHDIWFVALGSSSLDHAGMRAFLRQHRSEVRGCFVINLDCVGAGDLCLLKTEGLEGTRRADRRISRLLSGAATDLHLALDQRPCDWQGTDATVAMHSSLRSVTIRGVDGNGLPALSQTAADVPQNVSGDQAAQVAELVTEMIRRS